MIPLRPARDAAEYLYAHQLCHAHDCEVRGAIEYKSGCGCGPRRRPPGYHYEYYTGASRLAPRFSGTLTPDWVRMRQRASSLARRAYETPNFANPHLPRRPPPLSHRPPPATAPRGRLHPGFIPMRPR